jgi:hypothetical protein
MIRPSGRQVSAEEFAAEVAAGDERVSAVLAERRQLAAADRGSGVAA